MLLDTHIWIWLVQGTAKLGIRTRRRIEKAARAATSAGGLFVSAASVFEIAALSTSGRVQFTSSVDRWIRESLAIANLHVLDVDIRVALEAGLVPASALPDPIDRCLVATAREHDLPLVTADRTILNYSQRTGLVRTTDGAA